MKSKIDWGSKKVSRRSMVNLAWVSLMLIVLIISGSPLVWLHKVCIGQYAVISYYFALFGFFVFLGALLGFYVIDQKGSWEVDIPKIIIWGIPIGLFACSYLIYHGINMPGLANQLFAYIVNTDSGQVVAAQVILGYVLITSCYKTNG